MRARFRGSSVAARVRAVPVAPRIPGEKATDSATPYTVTIDGESHTIAVDEKAERYELARGLAADREHEVSLVREAEPRAGVHQFLGFEADALRAPPARPYAIEVVGDSITCGYGVLGADKSCPFSYATERVSLSFAMLAGEPLNADVTPLCWSGLGVVRNYDGSRSPTMPELYERTLPEGAASWFTTPGRREPDVVIAALGTNDFDDATKTPLDLPAFEARYALFLARVREVRPRAAIVVAQSPALLPEEMPAGPGPVRELARGAFLRIVEARRRAGDPSVEFLDMPWQDQRLGCDWHPNAAMHRLLANEVVRALRPKLVER